MKKQLNIKKLILLNLPYILMGLFSTNFGEAWRMAVGADASAKMLSFFSTLPVALASWWPSLHPLDLLVGLCCGGGLRLLLSPSRRLLAGGLGMVGVVHSVLSLGDAVFGLFDALGSLLHGLVQIVVDHREQRLALGHRIAFGYQHLAHDTVNLGRGAHRGDGLQVAGSRHRFDERALLDEGRLRRHILQRLGRLIGGIPGERAARHGEHRHRGHDAHDDLAFALLLALRLEIVERPHVGECLGVDEIGWPWKAPNCIEGARLSAQRLGAIRAPRTTVANRTHLLPPVRKKRGRFSRNSRASIIRGIVGKGNPQSSVRFVLAPDKRQRRRARLTRRTRLPYTEAKRRAEARSEEGMGDFSDRVFEVVRHIPRGKVATYGQVGRLIGAPRSARYVGYALRANPEPGAEVNSIPCHRVVFKDGGLCKGFAFGGPEVQREMLEAEGVAFADDAHVDMGVCLWDGRMDDADDPTLPMAPPEDFDWERELGA